MNYRMERMTDLKKKKLWVEQETGQIYTPKKNLLKVRSTTRKTIKTTAGRKNLKTVDV